MYRAFQFLWSLPLLSEFLVSSRHIRSVSNCATKAWISWPQNRIRAAGQPWGLRSPCFKLCTPLGRVSTTCMLQDSKADLDLYRHKLTIRWRNESNVADRSHVFIHQRLVSDASGERKKENVQVSWKIKLCWQRYVSLCNSIFWMRCGEVSYCLTCLATKLYILRCFTPRR